MKNNTIIIAGSKGIIGSSVVPMLKDAGYDTIELSLSLGNDLTDEEFVRDFFSKNHANGLINLFALNDHINSKRVSNKLMDIDLATFEAYLKINLTTLFSTCREFARSNESGSIVNFTSIYGLVSPNPVLYENDEKNIAYGVSKAGVIQLTRHLAVHFAPRIRVNCIMPGGVRHNQSDQFKNNYGKLVPMGRMMDVHEIFGILRFLISNDSSYCTGGLFPVDGGWTAW